jgi:hypothetical protein
MAAHSLKLTECRFEKAPGTRYKEEKPVFLPKQACLICRLLIFVGGIKYYNIDK